MFASIKSLGKRVLIRNNLMTCIILKHQLSLIQCKNIPNMIPEKQIKALLFSKSVNIS